MTKQNGPRYSDSKDFNETHDKIVTFLLERGEVLVLDAIEYLGVDVPVVDINGTERKRRRKKECNK